MKPLGDRRTRIRLEVVGMLRGTLELTEPARLLNISAHGALIETSAGVTVGSFQELLLTIDGQGTRVASRVRRLQHVEAPSESSKYLIALEFLSPSSSFTESIDHLSHES